MGTSHSYLNKIYTYDREKEEFKKVLFSSIRIKYVRCVYFVGEEKESDFRGTRFALFGERQIDWLRSG